MKKYKLVIADDGTGEFLGHPCNLCDIFDICHSDPSEWHIDKELFDLIMDCRNDDDLSRCIVAEEDMSKSDRIHLVSELLSEIIDVKGEEPPFYMYFLEGKQVNTGVEGDITSINLLQGDRLKSALRRIVDSYIKDEEISWEELGRPDNHIYMDLLLINDIIGE